MKISKQRLEEIVREELLKEDPAYTYGKDNANIEKGKLLLGKYIEKLAKTIKKQGHKDKAKQLVKGWDKLDGNLDDLLDNILGDLL